MKTFWLAHVKQVFSDKWHHYSNMHAQLLKKKSIMQIPKLKEPQHPRTNTFTRTSPQSKG